MDQIYIDLRMELLSFCFLCLFAWLLKNTKNIHNWFIWNLDLSTFNNLFELLLDNHYFWSVIFCFSYFDFFKKWLIHYINDTSIKSLTFEDIKSFYSKISLAWRHSIPVRGLNIYFSVLPCIHSTVKPSKSVVLSTF
jgi:hypothetical protein